MRKLVLLLALLLATPAAAQGTYSLAWDPVADADLSSYVLYRGTASHAYDANVDVGNVLTVVHSVPTDCATYFFAVKAKDTAGNLSTAFSNEVSGLPRVRINSIAPANLERGGSYTVAITGANFQAGTVVTGGGALVWGTPTIVSCTQVTVPVTVGTGAQLGTRDIEFRRTVDSVFGTLSGAVNVVPEAGPAIPTNLRRTGGG